ncbi:family 16 glycosylhydrolase [Shimia marina]|uniref:Beta-glucanase n=1 Tax=Shimia marina TaxID=321267 RepID=A0A0P1EV71_9RHOB|nr:family 16 glycosylhydrolase [Shimia marina]CUH54419.1 Beta-glucanase precursor [Shimia marina]SFE03269.1 Glycosyl hydrolases family 16 [Shimia marina]
MGKSHANRSARCGLFVAICLAFATTAPAEPGAVLAPRPTLLETFEKPITPDWHRHWAIAHYRFSHPFFDTDWSRDNLHIDKGLHLTLAPQDNAKNRFLGASLRHKERTHFGRYEASIRPAKGAGLVTGFFTYTGPHYGTRHDEIDIEFLGQDTTRLNIAWFVDGKLYDRKVDLGFDAAQTLRSYAFDWLPDRLRWYVDGTLLFEVTEEEAPLPKVPGFLFANLWAADTPLTHWAGTAQTGTHAKAFVGHMSFTPAKTPRTSQPQSGLETHPGS